MHTAMFPEVWHQLTAVSSSLWLNTGWFEAVSGGKIPADHRVLPFSIFLFTRRVYNAFLYSCLQVLGEYSYTASEYEPQVILEELFSLLERKFEGRHCRLIYSVAGRTSVDDLSANVP